MTSIVYLEEEIEVSGHMVAPGGLDVSTTYWWDVQAIDEYGARLAPTTPVTFTTDNSSNNNTGLIHGVIRGLTQSDVAVAQLTNAQLAQQNVATQPQFIYWFNDPAYGGDGTLLYDVEVVAGSGLQFQASALGYEPAQRTINVAVDQEIWNTNYALYVALDVEIDVNKGKKVHTNHKGPPVDDLNDVIPVVVKGSSSPAFNANQINAATVRFGVNRIKDANGATISDVEPDGDLDATFEYLNSEAGIECGDTEVTIQGELNSGEPFAGTDTIDTECNAGCH
jgi:hypothetical protein